MTPIIGGTPTICPAGLDRSRDGNGCGTGRGANGWDGSAGDSAQQPQKWKFALLTDGVARKSFSCANSTVGGPKDPSTLPAAPSAVPVDLYRPASRVDQNET